MTLTDNVFWRFLGPRLPISGETVWTLWKSSGLTTCKAVLKEWPHAGVEEFVNAGCVRHLDFGNSWCLQCPVGPRIP
jgi:hypothetical protein